MAVPQPPARGRRAARLHHGAFLWVALAAAGCITPVVKKADLDQANQLGQAGRHADAEGSLRALLQPAREGQGLSADDTLLVKSRLVPLLENQGRLGEAIELAQQVHQGWHERRGERAANTIAALGNLGRLYAAVGRTPQALDAQQRSTRLAIEVLGSWHEVAVSARNNLAATYLKVGRAAEAVRLQEVALDAARRTRGEAHPQTLAALSNLARSYLAARRTEDALAAAEKAMHGLAAAAGAANPTTLAATAQVVAALQARGADTQALPLQERLLGSSRETWGEQHRFTIEQQATLARLYARAGRGGDALALSGRFIAGAEKVRGQPGLARDDRRALFSAYADDYRFFAALHGRHGELAAGFRLAELGKARTLLESMSEQAASRSRVLPPDEQAALARHEQALHEHEKAISEATDARQRAALLLKRDAELRAYEAKVDEAKRRHPKFAQLRDPPIVSAADLPALVPAGAVFVGYTLRADHLSAWTADERGTLRFHDLGEVPHLADAVEALRRASSYLGGFRQLLAEDKLRVWRAPDGSIRLLDARRVPPPGSVAVQREAELAEWVGARVLAPLAGVLRGARRWIVSPDGALAQLPFELLAFDGRRVLDGVELHYTQSLSVYALARAQQQAYRSRVRPRELLALGNPVYEDSVQPAAERRALLRGQPLHSEHQLKEARLAWAPLPGTEQEVQRLRRLIPNSDAYLRADASEATLQRIAARGELRNYRYLHFAVHGHLSPDDPSLSSLVLSQRDLAAGTDGYVTAAEWPAYELQSDLTVLSACDTGLGENVSGEGVMGLPFALFVAGNVNTVLSLWPVLDAVAPVFMEKFFARLQAGQPAAQALAETKREMAADPKTRHPANWAPFILVGAG